MGWQTKEKDFRAFLKIFKDFTLSLVFHGIRSVTWDSLMIVVNNFLRLFVV